MLSTINLQAAPAWLKSRNYLARIQPAQHRLHLRPWWWIGLAHWWESAPDAPVRHRLGNPDQLRKTSPHVVVELQWGSSSTSTGPSPCKGKVTPAPARRWRWPRSRGWWAARACRSPGICRHPGLELRSAHRHRWSRFPAGPLLKCIIFIRKAFFQKANSIWV